AAQRDRNVRRRLTVQDNSERRRASRFAGRQSGGRAHGHARGIVVGVAHGNVGGVAPAVAAVRAGGGGGNDRVRHVAIVHEIIHAGYGHGLGRVPVRRRKRQAHGRDRPFSRVAGRDPDRDIGRRLRIEHDGKRGRSPGFGGGQAGGRRDGDAGRVVVGVGGA